MLVEALLVLLVAVIVLIDSVRVLGMVAMRVLEQTCGGHEHAAYRRRESACQSSQDTRCERLSATHML